MPFLFTVQLLLCHENASHLHSHPSLCVLIHSISFHHLKLHLQFGAQCPDSSNPNTGNSVSIWSYTTLRVTLKTQFFLFYRLQSFAVTAVWDELAWNNRHINQQEETKYNIQNDFVTLYSLLEWSHYSSITHRHCFTHSRLQHLHTRELRGDFSQAHFGVSNPRGIKHLCAFILKHLKAVRARISL